MSINATSPSVKGVNNSSVCASHFSINSNTSSDVAGSSVGAVVVVASRNPGSSNSFTDLGTGTDLSASPVVVVVGSDAIDTSSEHAFSYTAYSSKSCVVASNREASVSDSANSVVAVSSASPVSKIIDSSGVSASAANAFTDIANSIYAFGVAPNSISSISHSAGSSVYVANASPSQNSFSGDSIDAVVTSSISNTAANAANSPVFGVVASGYISSTCSPAFSDVS